jgi:hypothetical protein
MTDTPKVIALSAGGDDEELAHDGLGQEHIDELMVRLSRKLLQDGNRLAFGGTLGVPDNELTSLLIDAALGWLSEQRAEKTKLTDASSWPLVNYSIWPYHTRASQEDLAQLIGVCSFINVDPPDTDTAELAPLLNVDETNASARRYAADALTRMRKESTKETDFRIVWGGKIRGAMGWIAGIAEEVLFSLIHEKPVLILGGFGGCARVLADFIKDPDAPWPEELTLADARQDKKYDDLIDNYDRRVALTKRYDELKQRVTDLRKEVHEKKDKDEDILGVPSETFLAALNETSPSRAIKRAQEAARAVV